MKPLSAKETFTEAVSTRSTRTSLTSNILSYFEDMIIVSEFLNIFSIKNFLMPNTAFYNVFFCNYISVSF
jgi:hypothetical protein